MEVREGKGITRGRRERLRETGAGEGDGNTELRKGYGACSIRLSG